MENCGMQLEGGLRNDSVKDGCFIDIAYLRILRSKFRGV